MPSFHSLLLTLLLTWGFHHSQARIFTLEMHHRFSEQVKKWSETARNPFPAQNWPVKGSIEYYSQLAHRDRIFHGRRLSESDGPLTFSGGNSTFQISSLGFLHYTTVTLGTPGIKFLVALDTGSDLFWVPCECSRCASIDNTAYNADFELSMYDPKESSTSQKVTCNNSLCMQHNGCPGTISHCPYSVSYVSSETSTSGILVEDVLHLKTEGSRQELVEAYITFGCGQVQTGSFLDVAAPNGLFGLGLEKISVPSILSREGYAADSFSMCFGRDGTGRINFGDKGSLDQEETPFNVNSLHPTYNISVTQIRVGTTLIDSDFTCLFDSGTSFTYLVDPPYTRLSESFHSQAQDKRRPPDPRIPFEYCYDMRPDENTSLVPSMSLSVKGGGQLAIFDPIIVISTKQELVYCLAIIKSAETNIIGQNFMTGYRIVFDREKLVLGWKKFDCYDIEESSILPSNSLNSTSVPPAVAVGLTNHTSPKSAEESKRRAQNSIASPFYCRHILNLIYTSVGFLFSCGFSEAFGTFGFDIHHRYSDPVKGILDLDGLPEKGSTHYYAAMAHRDRLFHGRRLAGGSVESELLTFSGGNETYRFSSLGLAIQLGSGAVKIQKGLGGVNSVSKFESLRLLSSFRYLDRGYDLNCIIWQVEVAKRGRDRMLLHYANVTVGTPSLSFLVALDTGSNLFWLPCDCSSCVRGIKTRSGQVCFHSELYAASFSDLCNVLLKQVDFNIYSRNTSSTSTTIPCNSNFCQEQRRCSAPTNACPYQVSYLSSNTSSTGILVEDVLRLTTDDSQLKTVDARIKFGCGVIQTGSFLDGAAPNGLFGLGINNISVPSILASEGLASNSFSMCFGADGLGRIRFGDNGSSDQGETPFNLDQFHPTYNISLTQISVGDNVTNVEFTAIFDSGTSFTYLNDPAYSIITESFNSQAQDKRHQSDSDIPFNYCYELSANQTSFETPDVNLTMKGGDQFSLTNPIQLFSAQDTYVYCLAVVKSGDVNIIGQNFMTGYHVVFDREKMVLGWKPSNCYDAKDSNTLPINPKKNTGVPPTTVNTEATSGNKNGSPAPPPPASNHSPRLGSFASTLIVVVSLFSQCLIILSL
ncbi:hypothetical protein RJ639_031029 [Escallonia herrerae]|uniref:Peptidase A1 domain-containing protein n=1 Tax=Escallonia herrerae TaxID=1293975 RepID=A0AA89BHW7_9ASTE|nr:hypothetical protein RJ639_031029 [Escallonia herrerae]